MSSVRAIVPGCRQRDLRHDSLVMLALSDYLQNGLKHTLGGDHQLSRHSTVDHSASPITVPTGDHHQATGYPITTQPWPPTTATPVTDGSMGPLASTAHTNSSTVRTVDLRRRHSLTNHDEVDATDESPCYINPPSVAQLHLLYLDCRSTGQGGRWRS